MIGDDDIHIVATALGESEAVRPAREALTRLEAELSILQEFYDMVASQLNRAKSRSDELAARRRSA